MQETLQKTIGTSVTGAIWHLNNADERMVLALSQKHNLPEVAARVLAARGLTTDEAENFLNPTLKSLLPDPFHFMDMEKAASRVADAIIKGEKIAIFGDYDVDGATSSGLLKRYFRDCGNDPLIYIPDRIDEGYGPNSEAMLELARRGITLCITVDCGTLSFEPIAAANKAGMEVIVIDHHLSTEMMPEALAVVNPNRIDEVSEYRYLAAVGMCFMLAIAVNSKLRSSGWFTENRHQVSGARSQESHDFDARPLATDTLNTEPDLLSLLDIVALGTVCDVMPLTGLNRAFVAQGLKVLRNRKNIGLNALADVAGIDSIPSAYHLGFVLGPRINAGGRVGKSDLGARLLSTENYDEAIKIAQELNHLNAERKTIEQLVLEDAIAQVEQGDTEAPIIFASGQGWHPGVIGIVASRLKERYNRPTAVIALDNGIGKASGRSISGIDLGAAIISAQQQGILVKGGGHAMAAGFTVEENKIPELHEYLCKKFTANTEAFSSRKLKIDGYLTVSALNTYLAKSLSKIEPFGVGNPEPLFAVTDAYLAKVDVIGGSHLKCIIGDARAGGKGGTIKAMAFRSVDTDLGRFLLSASGKNLSFAGKIKINNWQGYERAEFFLEDVAC
jgi:single-stranded-DNA-specific exonuclease